LQLDEDESITANFSYIRPKVELSSTSIERVLKAIRKRLGSQTILLSQLKLLGMKLL